MRLRLINRWNYSFDRFNYRMLLKEIKFAKIRSVISRESLEEREQKRNARTTSKLKHYLVFRSIHFILVSEDTSILNEKIERIVCH